MDLGKLGEVGRLFHLSYLYYILNSFLSARIFQKVDTWCLYEPHLRAVMVLHVPHLVLGLVADVLLDERHPGVVEGRPAVDHAVLLTAIPLIDHRQTGGPIVNSSF